MFLVFFYVMQVNKFVLQFTTFIKSVNIFWNDVI